MGRISKLFSETRCSNGGQEIVPGVVQLSL
jgi:hypothetical protein